MLILLFVVNDFELICFCNQGININLTADEHCIGRLIPDKRFQIESPAVSANHCKIYRKKGSPGDSNNNVDLRGSVMLKDTRLFIVMFNFYWYTLFIFFVSESLFG